MDGVFSAHVNWSIYVRTSNKRKLLEVHVPPITQALDGVEFGWQVITEDYNPGLFRLVTFQNFKIARPDDIILPVLRRAFRLSSSWSIFGLGDMESGALRHAGGHCTPKHSNKPPSLAPMLFEIQPGTIGPMSPDGGWPILELQTPAGLMEPD